MTRILHLIDVAGDAPAALLRLLLHLDRARRQPTVLALGPDGEALGRLRALGVEVVTLPLWQRGIKGVSSTFLDTAYYTMPQPAKLFSGPDPQTTDLLYVRFIGDHKRMDRLVAGLCAEGKRSGDWSAIAVDRSAEMRAWMRPLRERARSGAEVFAYFNNHYAGFAPDSARLFRQMWEEAE